MIPTATFSKEKGLGIPSGGRAVRPQIEQEPNHIGLTTTDSNHQRGRVCPVFPRVGVYPALEVDDHECGVTAPLGFKRRLELQIRFDDLTYSSLVSARF
jgi:hypothetical protein